MSMRSIASALVSACLLLSACGGSKKVNTARTLSFNVESKGVNDGRTFYVVVRPTDEASFMTSSYDQITKLVEAKENDFLAMELIWPKWSRTIDISVPKDQSIAVYCLFTEPNADWKVLLTPPLKKNYVLNLGDSNIELALTPTK